jgi:alpha-glucosidase
MRAVIEGTLADHAPAAASPTWVLSNHDVVRHVTRYGRGDTSFSMDNRRLGEFSDLELGTRRARAAILVTMALPGAVYVYQGEELGLSEVEDLSEDLLQDPIWPRSGYTDKGRDGCRVPIPWSGDASPFGFNAEGVQPWLPQPAEWKSLTVAAEAGDPDSMLELYRAALHCRRRLGSLALPDLSWLPTADGVLGFARGNDFLCVANTSGSPVDLPAHKSVLLSSVRLINDQLPSDAAVWLTAE